MQKKLTITVDEKVYPALHKVVGRGRISKFIENLIRPHVLEESRNRNGREALISLDLTSSSS